MTPAFDAEDLDRALVRIFDACRKAGIDLGPVMSARDFYRFPHRLADAFEEAVDPARAVEVVAEMEERA